MKKPRELLLIIVILAACGLNYPWLKIASVPLLVFGIPVLYFYLFGLWLLFICLVYLLVNRLGPARETDTHTEKDNAG